MLSCASLDPLVTPFIDDELPPPDRDAVADHLRVCAPCHSRVAAERAVRDLLRARRDALDARGAPDALRSRCEDVARRLRAEGASASPAVARVFRMRAEAGGSSRASAWTRLRPLALAASLVVVVGGAFLYEATDRSTRLMAAELTADHVKCFAMNTVFRTQAAAADVERSLAQHFGWNVHLPDAAAAGGLELVGSRQCLYGEGRVAHIMYRHEGHPVSLFMLPDASRPRDFVDVLGHEAAIWCVGNRTFVLIANEPRKQVEQMAAIVQASLR